MAPFYRSNYLTLNNIVTLKSGVTEHYNVIKDGTIRKPGYGFLFGSITTTAVSLAVSEIFNVK